MKFPINLSKFKKISHDGDTAVLRNQAGHEFKIAVKALNPKMRERINALPMHSPDKAAPMRMAEGGAVEGGAEEEQKNQQATGSALPQQPVVINLNAGNGAQPAMQQPVMAAPAPVLPAEMSGGYAVDPTQYMQQPPMEVAPPQPMSVAPPPLTEQVMTPMQESPKRETASADQGLAPTQKPDVFGTEAQASTIEKGMREEKAGILGESQALGAQGRREADVLATQQANLQDLMLTHQENEMALTKEREDLLNDIKNSHIDPNRYMGSLSTGQKVLTSIGLILGGMGAGSTGGENMVMKYLQQQIDRDIDAQRSELGRKQTLLSANMAQFKNERDATDMTRLQMNDMLNAQLKEAAAKSTDQIAKMRALKQVGEIDKNNAALQGQIAMRRTIMSGAESGKLPPEHVINAMVPEGQKAKAFEELKEAQSLTRARDNLLSAFDELDEKNTVGNRIKHIGFTPAAVEAIRDPLIASLSKETAGRFTEQDAKFVGTLFPAPGDAPETITDKRRKLNDLISQKMDFPLLKAFRINPDKMGRMNSAGQSKFSESAPVLKPKK